VRYQLRLYTIKAGALDEFVREWSDGVRPLRLRFGFDVVGAWVIRETNQFVWIVGHEGPGSFEERDAAYYASAERAAMDPDPARHIATAETHFIDPVLP
jgi:hypothetical protein